MSTKEKRAAIADRSVVGQAVLESFRKLDTLRNPTETITLFGNESASG